MQQSGLDNSSDFQMDLYWILTGFWYHIQKYIQISPHSILHTNFFHAIFHEFHMLDHLLDHPHQSMVGG